VCLRHGEGETREKGENLTNGYSDKKKIPLFPLSRTPPPSNRGKGGNMPSKRIATLKDLRVYQMAVDAAMEIYLNFLRMRNTQ